MDFSCSRPRLFAAVYPLHRHLPANWMLSSAASSRNHPLRIHHVSLIQQEEFPRQKLCLPRNCFKMKATYLNIGTEIAARN